MTEEKEAERKEDDQRESRLLRRTSGSVLRAAEPSPVNKVAKTRVPDNKP